MIAPDSVAGLALLSGGATRPLLPDPLEASWNDAPACERLHEDSDQRILRCTFPAASVMSAASTTVTYLIVEPQ